MSAATTIDTTALEAYLSGPLAVLALWQPWATLCVAPDPAHGGAPGKQHETRHWTPRADLPIRCAVHATKTFNADVRAAFRAPVFKDALRRCAFYPGDPRPLANGRMRASLPAVPMGALIGLVTIDAIYRTSGSLVNHTDFPVREDYELTSDDLAFGNYDPGRFAWRLSGPVMLPEPIPFIGRQDALYPVGSFAREGINVQLRAMLAVA